MLLVGRSYSAYAQPAQTNVSAGIMISKDLGRADLLTVINITVHLKLSDKAAFDRAVDALYDPASPTFHQWMTNSDLRKYAPAEQQRQAVRDELQKHGLTILSTHSNGFTIRARGTIASVENAFNTEIHQFEYNGKVFRANVRNARLNGAAGDYVSTVAGLESHQVRPMAVRAQDPLTHAAYPSVALSKLAQGSGFPQLSTTDCLSSPSTYNLQDPSGSPSAVYSGAVFATSLVCDYLPSQLQNVLGLDDVYAAGYNGAGQTIVLVEAFGYPTLRQDANAFFKMANLPLLNLSNFSIVYPEGKPNPNLGILTGWNVEMALDLDWSHVVAPGAKIVEVVTNGQDSEDFQHSIAYVAENNLGNSVSNSYEEDIDIIAGPLEQTSWDQTIEVASAKGISVNFSTGDAGDHGLGTPLGAPGVPSVAPHATAVGGTTILNDVNNPGSTITTSWGNVLSALGATDANNNVVVFDPPTQYFLNYGGGGGGQSVYWTKPSWQKSLPGSGRQTPDVSALSNPFTGVPIVITFGKVQYLEYGWGGTSLGCPIFSAFWTLANQKAGHALGQAAPAIAALPYGGVQDVLATTDSTPNNLAGTITDQNGTTAYTPSQLFSPVLEGNHGFTSAIWPFPSYFFWFITNIGVGGTQTTYDVNVIGFGFGLDSSLTVRKGWDNATGWGTPYGLAFLDAVTRKD
jgi:subtilase family serine protease